MAATNTPSEVIFRIRRFDPAADSAIRREAEADAARERAGRA